MLRKCEDCGRPYELSDLPVGWNVSPGRCDVCNALVYAVEEINGEGPFYIAGDEQQLEDMDGADMSCTQCEECGWCGFTYRHTERAIVCDGDNDDGCGARYHIHVVRAYRCVFP